METTRDRVVEADDRIMRSASARIIAGARRVFVACVATAAVLALVTIAAWLSGEERLAAFRGMKANTAAALGLLCGAAWLGAGRRLAARIAQVFMAAVAAAIGGVTLIEYTFGTDLGVDTILVADALATAPATPFPGRMGSNTAAMLVLLAGGVVVHRRGTGRWARLGEIIVLAAGLIALLGVISHVYGVRNLFAVSMHTTMAPHTAVAGLALAIALLADDARRPLSALVLSDGSGGFMSRRLVPVTTLAPLAIGWITTRGVRAGVYDVALGASIDALLAVITMVIVVVVSARTLNELDARRRAKEEEVHELNTRLSQRARELEESNRELESFSYSVSHDLRSPIRHIGGFVELLEKRSRDQLDDKGRHYVTTISEAAKRAGNLIDDLLAFSRMARTELRHGVVRTRSAVDDVWRQLAPDREGRVVELRLGELPDVEGDADMIRLVLQNLLSNAVKYTRTRERARIDVGSRAADGEVVFFVKDNGVGFDMQYADKLYGVFQRLHAASEFEGVGIGLANVKRIVQRHGGRVWAEGALGEGATFYFTLPRKAVG